MFSERQNNITMKDYRSNCTSFSTVWSRLRLLCMETQWSDHASFSSTTWSAAFSRSTSPFRYPTLQCVHVQFRDDVFPAQLHLSGIPHCSVFMCSSEMMCFNFTFQVSHTAVCSCAVQRWCVSTSPFRYPTLQCVHVQFRDDVFQLHLSGIPHCSVFMCSSEMMCFNFTFQVSHTAVCSCAVQRWCVSRSTSPFRYPTLQCVHVQFRDDVFPAQLHLSGIPHCSVFMCSSEMMCFNFTFQVSHTAVCSCAVQRWCVSTSPFRYPTLQCVHVQFRDDVFQLHLSGIPHCSVFMCSSEMMCFRICKFSAVRYDRQCCQIGLTISSPKAHQNPPTSTKTNPKF